jgi:polysaccharide pyruvyl transferase WcaK-like protein
MRILIEPGSYTCRNMGDLAMFLATVARLEQRWPEAELVTFTSAPDRLRRYAPRVTPYSIEDRELLLAAHHPHWGLPHRMPLAARVRLGLGRLVASAPRFVRARRPAGSRIGNRDRPDQEGWRGILRSLSLVAVSGAGGLCDPFLRHAWSTLELLQIAAAAGVPTALFSQGIGPMRAPLLRSKAGAVLPRVTLVALREPREGPRLLRELGVAADRIHVGGDDAVELAYRVRGPATGCCLGVNLRLAGYANLDPARAASVLATVRQFARARSLEVLPIPISFQDLESDLRAVASVAGPSGSLACPEEPAAIACMVGRCRLVVTGSYHAAVFALAQGIPAVTLSNSRYYDGKFTGLAEMFGVGCRVVRLGEVDALQRLRGALDELWETGAGLRDLLLRSAVDQIARSQATYQRVYEIVSPHQAPPLSRAAP